MSIVTCHVGVKKSCRCIVSVCNADFCLIFACTLTNSMFNALWKCGYSASILSNRLNLLEHINMHLIQCSSSDEKYPYFCNESHIQFGISSLKML